MGWVVGNGRERRGALRNDSRVGFKRNILTSEPSKICRHAIARRAYGKLSIEPAFIPIDSRAISLNRTQAFWGFEIQPIVGGRAFELDFSSGRARGRRTTRKGGRGPFRVVVL